MTNMLVFSSVLLVFLCYLVQVSYENYSSMLLHHHHHHHHHHRLQYKDKNYSHLSQYPRRDLGKSPKKATMEPKGTPHYGSYIIHGAHGLLFILPTWRHESRTLSCSSVDVVDRVSFISCSFFAMVWTILSTLFIFSCLSTSKGIGRVCLFAFWVVDCRLWVHGCVVCSCVSQ